LQRLATLYGARLLGRAVRLKGGGGAAGLECRDLGRALGGERRCTARKGERDLLRAAGPSGPHGGGVHGLWSQLAGEGGE